MKTFMIGYFEVLDVNTNKIIGKYKYSTVSDTTKAWLRRESDHLKITCCCNENKVEMKISSDLKIYPAKNETGSLHDKRCPKYPLASDNIWESSKDDGLFFYIAGPDANAKDYALKINSVTSSNLFKKKIYPETYKEFNRHVYKTMASIKRCDGVILKDTYSALFKDPAKIELTDEIFIYGILRKVQSTDFSKDILYLDIEDIFGTMNRYYVRKDLFLEMYNAARAKYYRLLVCGFAYKASSKSKIMTISDFYMTTINEYGVIF